ncbi:MAG: hypothetical protein U1B80_09705, partial [Anaerolineaceae bacterium]|nr:hypothetical protein [Anaerolineaceae bacterium]
LGWPGHESQWRGGDVEMRGRQENIGRLYQTNDWLEAEAIIQQYGIRYIYIGSLERGTYRISETKFQTFLKPVMKNGSIVIYEAPQYAAPRE